MVNFLSKYLDRTLSRNVTLTGKDSAGWSRYMPQSCRGFWDETLAASWRGI